MGKPGSRSRTAAIVFSIVGELHCTTTVLHGHNSSCIAILASPPPQVSHPATSLYTSFAATVYPDSAVAIPVQGTAKARA